MEFLFKNKGVIIFYLVVVICSFAFIGLSPNEEINNENNSNLFVQN